MIRTKNGKTVHVFEERPENLPEQAALLLNFHGGGFLKGRTDRDRRYLLGHGTTKLPGMGY